MNENTDSVESPVKIDTFPSSSEVRPKQKKGFALWDKEKLRNVASKGGKAGHAKGTAHKFTPEEAKIFGSKGGKTPRRKKT